MNLALTMKVDTATLEKSLTRARKAFGESTDQALYRWGVQVARDLAGATQAFGKGKKTKDLQRKAIYKDAMNVCLLVTSGGELKSGQQCYDWIEKNRTRKRRRTNTLGDAQKKTVTAETLNQALAAKFERIGMAKGAFLGAGMELVSKQKGTDKISIGKSYLTHAQKWSKLGNATVKNGFFTPSAALNNTAKHSADPEILSDTKKKTTVKRALINTLKWYDKATTAKLKKV